MAVIAAGLSLISIIILYCVGYSDQTTDCNLIINSIFIGGIAGGITGNRINNAPDNKRNAIWTMISLGIVFSLPFAAVIAPLSKYHNLNQIERDKKIVEILQVTSDLNNLRILLPPEYASESSYMEKVFSVRWTTEILAEETVTIKAWKDIAIPCRDGDKYWRRAEIPLYEEIQGNEITLFFDHTWKDYETTKTVSLNPL